MSVAINTDMTTLTEESLASLFGAAAYSFWLGEEGYNFINSSYRVIDGEELDKLIIDILNFIDHDDKVVGIRERACVWNTGWEENLEAFKKNKDDLSAVNPRFLKANQPVRLFQQYVVPSNPYFERDFSILFQYCLFSEYLMHFEHVYEFGCGSGFSTVNIAKLFPNMKIYATDFVPSAIQLINEIAEHHNFDICGSLFDMMDPDYDLNMRENSCALTVCSIEQVSNNFHAFIDYLIEKSPKRCIHIEPIYELYDEDNLVDYLAMKFHKKRQYPIGFLPYLEKLQSDGIIRIDKVHRVMCGGRNTEAYSYIIWHTINGDS